MNRIISLLLLVASLNGAVAQEATHGTSCQTCVQGTELPMEGVTVLKVDFKDRCAAPDLTKLRLKRGDFYAVHVDNLNLNLYKVELDARDTLITQALGFPSFSSISLDSIKGLIGDINTSTSAPLELSFEEKKVDEDEKALRERQALEKTALDVHTATLVDINKRMDQLNLDLNLYQLKFSSEFQCGASFTELDKSKATFQSLLTEAKKLRTDISALLTKVDKGNKSYLAFTSQSKYEKLLSEVDDLKKNHKTIKDVYADLLTTIGKSLENVGSEKVLGTLRNSILLENNATLGYRSLPIQYNGGDATVKLKITPLDPKSNLESYSTTWKFPTSRPVYYGVSSSFYASDLYDQTFSTTSTAINDSTTVYGIVSEGSGEHEFGAAVKFAYGVKLLQGAQNDLGLHLTVGPGVNVASKLRPRLLYGFGLAYGRRHMLMLDAGWILGFVDRRSNALPNNEGYAERPDETTVTRTVTGGFLSLGYMFTF